MACLASDIVCKPLNEREHKFYKSMSRSLVPFVPRYEGTMKVEVHEDAGYITFNGHPPRKFSSKRNLNHHQLLQLHLQGKLIFFKMLTLLEHQYVSLIFFKDNIF